MLMSSRAHLRRRRVRWVVGQAGLVTAGIVCHFAAALLLERRREARASRVSPSDVRRRAP